MTGRLVRGPMRLAFRNAEGDDGVPWVVCYLAPLAGEPGEWIELARMRREVLDDHPPAWDGYKALATAWFRAALEGHGLRPAAMLEEDPPERPA
jgi:hypothetical protein